MPQATTNLAETGYTEAMKLMARGQLRSVMLWRREALDRYRGALTDGGPSSEWMEKFNQDLSETIGTRYSASFIGPDDEDYPTEVGLEDGPAAVIKLSRDAGENESTATIIVRPQADQVLTPITRIRFM
jgi:hypothetical protein